MRCSAGAHNDGRLARARRVVGREITDVCKHCHTGLSVNVRRTQLSVKNLTAKTFFSDRSQGSDSPRWDRWVVPKRR